MNFQNAPAVNSKTKENTSDCGATQHTTPTIPPEQKLAGSRMLFGN
jgi:hypothetical protein